MKHKEYCINLPKECGITRSSKYNLSILPTTGGLNNVKGRFMVYETISNTLIAC